jgi:hypothetical protein
MTTFLAAYGVDAPWMPQVHVTTNLPDPAVISTLAQE